MTLCCHLHKPGRCCDPEDCSPCCERCPDPCPLDTGKRGRPPRALAELPGFAVNVANRLAGVGADYTVTFGNVDTSDYVYRVRDPERMRFTVDHYDEDTGTVVPDAVYEVSIRRVS